MVPQSAVIREWLGEPPYLFAVKDIRDFSPNSRRDADFETGKFIAPDSASRKVLAIQQLGRLDGADRTVTSAVVVLHPFEDADLEALARAVNGGSLERVFVMIWSPRDIVRTWLDGLGATNLHTSATLPAPDPVMVEAGKSMVNEEYNGLGSGNGKDAVVQLVRAFTAAGYPLEVDAWLRAYFAAGGSFRHAKEVEKLVTEMKKGVKHRVKDRYRASIVEILRDRVTAPAK
jgi:hypothetical protein